MVLKNLRIKNFRVFDNLEINLHPEINIIFGLNGQGKTSVLEAIYYLSITKSFRAKNDNIVLKNNKEFFEVTGKFEDNKIFKHESRIYYSKNEGKHAFINKTKVKLFSEIIGIVPLILLSLEDIELTSGVPASRRKFLDVTLSQLYPGYLLNLQRYKKCIMQKNKLLSSEEKKNILKELEVWNKQLSVYGAKIVFLRLQFVDFLNKNIGQVYNKISGKKEKIKIEYLTAIKESNTEISEKDIELQLKEEYKKNSDSEIKRQTSIIGPHRDDIQFLKNDYLFRSHGSQGENKSFLLALKFLEGEYILNISGKKPLVLLDDIFGELDEHRIENLLRIVTSQGQSFITTTHNKRFDNIIKDKSSLFEISNNILIQ